MTLRGGAVGQSDVTKYPSLRGREESERRKREGGRRVRGERGREGGE